MRCVDLVLGAALALASLGALAAADPNAADPNAAGRALYEGHWSGDARVTSSAGRSLSAAAGACVSCHRPSGLGSFEGGVVVPPIAGSFLTEAYDPATSDRFPWPAAYRKRPAYTAASFARLLAEGIAPDGYRVSSLMPRVRMSDDEASGLYAYLAGLSSQTAPGVTDTTVVFATITTPEVPEAERAQLLRVLETFFAEKNALTRAEPQRRAQAIRTQYVMYRRYRTWRLVHWALTGPPSTWRAQLQAHYAREPVFAVLSGIGYDTWAPIHEFCEDAKLPCLLPSAAMPPAQEGFYSVYFSRGLGAEAAAVAQYRRETGDALPLQVWTADDALGRRQAYVMRAALHDGAAAPPASAAPAYAVVAAGSWDQIAARDRAAQREGGRRPERLYVLASGLADPTPAAMPEALRGRVIVIGGEDLGTSGQQRLARAQAWLSSRHLAHGHERIGAQALFVATLAVESLLHVDERFSREYCVEKIEHNLENMPPLTAFPRLSIGPGQRFAAKLVAAWRFDQTAVLAHDWSTVDSMSDPGGAQRPD